MYTFDFKDSEGRPFAYYQYPLELTKITLGFNASARQDCELALESVKIHFTAQARLNFPRCRKWRVGYPHKRRLSHGRHGR